MPKCTKKFRDKVLALDGWRCANPFCEHPIQAKDPFSQKLSAHSLAPPKHDDVNEAITLCAYCHDKVEHGFTTRICAVGPDDKPLMLAPDWKTSGWTKRTTGREYEIRILEWYKDNRPDKFRWGPVLKLMYQKRKVAF